MADHGSLEGSIDEAAQAIEALLSAPAGASAATEGGAESAEEEEIAAAIEGRPAPATDQTPAEEALEGDTPGDPALVAEPTPPPVQAQAPQPAPKPAPQVAAAPGTQAPLTAQEQLSQLNQLVPILQGQLQAAFPEVRSQDDLIKLAGEDPARYIAFKANQERIQQVQGLQANAQAAYRTEWVASETNKLHTLIPDIADPEKGPALQQKLTAYAKECGYSEQQIMWAAATDVKMLHDAMQYRDQAKETEAKAKADAAALKAAQAKAAEAPPVQRPGTAQPTDKKTERAKELTERFSKSGHPDDLAVLLHEAGLG